MNDRKKDDLDALATLFGGAALKAIQKMVPKEEGVPSLSVEKNEIAKEVLLPKEQLKETIDETRLVGQKNVKRAISNIVGVAKVFAERKKRGLKTKPLTYHAVFYGNPGTGKTTFARVYAQKIRELGLLSKGHLVETSRDGLVAGFQGQTALKVKELVAKALGGMLFIDEAYSLKQGKDDSYGGEAIDTLIKAMEDHRDDLVVIFAGYTDEMRQFLTNNPGLRSRIPHEIEFEDFDAKELLEIFEVQSASAGYVTAPKALELVSQNLDVKRRGPHFGNARVVRNIFESAVMQQSTRLAAMDLTSLDESMLSTLIYSDFTDDPSDHGSEPEHDAHGIDGHESLVRLEQLIGIKAIKDKLRRLWDFMTISRLRGVDPVDINMHMVFTGNPGTGKTTVARLLGNILRELGYLSSGHLVETDRSGLVADYAGQTATKTRDKVKEALGGVLFIDEAYSLSRKGESDAYGREATETLMKQMEDEMGKFVVILAGYDGLMQDFLKINPGLKSRIGTILPFPDYDSDELMLIARKMIKDSSFCLDDDAASELGRRIESEKCLILARQEHFANARTVRQILENAFQNQATRLANKRRSSELDEQEITRLLAEDFRPSE